MTLVDLLRKNRATTVVWAEQPLSMLETKDNIFQQRHLDYMKLLKLKLVIVENIHITTFNLQK